MVFKISGLRVENGRSQYKEGTKGVAPNQDLYEMEEKKARERRAIIPKRRSANNFFYWQDLNETHKYTDDDMLIITIVGESYTKRSDRKTIVEGYKYIDSLSTDLVAHYEDSEDIILGIHGADDIKLTGIAAVSKLDKNKTFKTIDVVCEKLDSLLSSYKNVIVGGHSIGGYAINHCLTKYDYPYKFVSFGAYAPRPNREWAMNKVRKHLYKTDWLSNNLIKTENNCMVYNETTAINSHGLFMYKNQDRMNRNLLK